MSAPVLLWVLSRFGTSYFVERYFLPYTLGAAVVVSELLTAFFVEIAGERKRASAVALGGLAALLAVFIVTRVALPYAQEMLYPPHDYTEELAAMLPHGEPIVIPKTDIFDMMAHYRDAADRPIVFPFDWELALDPRSPKWLVSAEREMENAALAGYYPGKVKNSAELLRTTPQFAVVTDGTMPWLQIRVVEQPHWRVKKIGEYRNGFLSNSVYQVSRLDPLPGR